MKRCVICRGKINEEHLCTRCGANLSCLSKIDKQSSHYCYLAMQAIKHSEFEVAKSLILKSIALLDNTFKRYLLNFIERMTINIKNESDKKNSSP